MVKTKKSHIIGQFDSGETIYSWRLDVDVPRGYNFESPKICLKFFGGFWDPTFYRQNIEELQEFQ